MNWVTGLIAWIGLVATAGFTYATLKVGAWGAALIFDLIMVPFVIAMIVISWED